MIERGRILLIGGLVGLVGVAYAALRRPAKGPKPAVGQPLLRMPFPAGTVVVCVQGNGASPPHTHSLPQNQRALDFAQPTDTEVPVTSAAEGIVSFAYADASRDDVEGGLGYGNHVKILHPGGFNTFYAHLDHVDVHAGDRVAPGDPIGTMGLTGRAGSRHLHFALHSSNTDGEGAGLNEPIERLVTADIRAGTPFRPFGGAEFIGVPDVPWTGGVYASDNAPEDARTSPEQLRENVERSQRRVLDALARRARLDTISRERDTRPVERISEELDAVLRDDPQHPVGLYLRATLVEIPRRDWSRARDSLSRALAEDRKPWRREAWLAGRSTYHLGRVFQAEGKLNRAREHFRSAIAQSTSADVVEDSKRAIASLDAVP